MLGNSIENQPIKFTHEVVDTIYNQLSFEEKYIRQENGLLVRLDPIMVVKDYLESSGYKLEGYWYSWGSQNPFERLEINLERLNNYVNEEMLLKVQSLKNFLVNEKIHEDSRSRPLIIGFTLGESNFEYNINFWKDINELNSKKDILDFLAKTKINDNFFLLKVDIDKHQNIEVIIDSHQKRMMKEIILSYESLKNHQGISSEIYQKIKGELNKIGKTKDFANNYLKENIFDTLLDYFVNHEILAKLYGQFYDQNDGRLPQSYRDKYVKNWENNDDIKRFQRLLWGILLDFRHPLTGHKFTLSEWMSFPLHHWKTASGHENKYECFFSALIPIIESGTYGHKWVGNQVDLENNGATMEMWFRDIINSIISGNIPNMWKDHLSIEELGLFRTYSNSIGQFRELINIFLS
ncbi:MAG: hypothetical protein P8Y97_09980 [Candidatus Lokiarchaeota archaeon]